MGDHIMKNFRYKGRFLNLQGTFLQTRELELKNKYTWCIMDTKLKQKKVFKTLL